MSAGPILIFDKSLIEMLSPDEAVWLGQFYRVNIVPVFLVETLADLEKEVAAGRTPEQVVGRLAEKTNIMTADPNTHHWRLALSNLLGAEVHLPDDDTCLTRRLCDKFLSPEWRRLGVPRREKTDEDREREKKLIAEIRAATKAPTARSGNLDAAQFVVLEHRIPRRMGKWTMVPPDTPDADKDGW
jgi:hypothetical protein